MKNTQNMTIGLLLITAAVLTALLISSYVTPQPTYAAPSVKEGDYIMGTGQWSPSTDLVYVLDIAAQRINVYTANINTNSVELVATTDLERAFASGR